MSIANIKESLANNKREIILTLIMILIASISFGLGYLVNREFNHAPIIIEKNSGATYLSHEATLK